MIDIFKKVDLAGKDGIVSKFSPGVFLQVIWRLFMFLMMPLILQGSSYMLNLKAFVCLQQFSMHALAAIQYSSKLF